MSDAIQKILDARQREIESPKKFLDAWKRGIEKSDKEFFNAASINIWQITNKNDLAPDIGFIKKVIGGYSRGIQALVALMCSFYDTTEGQKLLEQIDLPNFVSAISILDGEGQSVISELCNYYTGW